MPRATLLSGDGASAHERFIFFTCPGCQNQHGPRVAGPEPCWTWNGSLDRPTIAPSILCRTEYGDADRQTRVCHSFVTDGRIQFLGDCTHALAGQTVDLPEVDARR